jgi:hypothetical protein
MEINKKLKFSENLFKFILRIINLFKVILLIIFINFNLKTIFFIIIDL